MLVCSEGGLSVSRRRQQPEGNAPRHCGEDEGHAQGLRVYQKVRKGVWHRNRSGSGASAGSCFIIIHSSQWECTWGFPHHMSCAIKANSANFISSCVTQYLKNCAIVHWTELLAW